jgi:hypothetical protein
VTKRYYAHVSFRDQYQGTVWVVDDSNDDGPKPLKHHVHHSPDGHSWGYHGSGPAELAKDLLWDVFGMKPDPALYQAFKDEVIALLDQDHGWELRDHTIRRWVQHHEEQEVSAG